MSIASNNSLKVLLDSGSILPCSQPEIRPEVIANIVSEDVQEVAHPDDVVTIKAKWVPACEKDEHLKAQVESPTSLQDVQPSFPMSNESTTPVAGLPKSPTMDPGQCHSLQPSAVPQAPLEGTAGFQPEHDGGLNANGPNFAQNHFRTVVDLELLAVEDPLAHDPRPPFSQGQNAHLQREVSILSVTEHAGSACPGALKNTMTDASTFMPSASDSDATTYLNDGSSLEPFSFAPVETACPKCKTRLTVIFEDVSSSSSSSSSLAPTMRKRRCLDDDKDEIREGKFGVYRLADASAVVMAEPAHDPKPVDVSRRRTHDAHSNLLRTRRFGAMELDDSYSKRSVKVTNELPAEMTCVRACDWTDQPCGLFVEMNPSRIRHHLLHWHGIKFTGTALCKFEDCSKSEAMINLGRHIESVHYATSYECPYCGKRWSRADSLDRHQGQCKPLLASKDRATKGSRKFNLRGPKKLVYGYIIPARNAT